MYEGRYAYCSVIVDKKFSSTICISKSVFPGPTLAGGGGQQGVGHGYGDGGGG